MPGLLTLVIIGILLYTLRSIIRSFVRGTAPHEDRKRARLMGEEMVRDPECRTYVPKGRAIVRRVNSVDLFFCSETCAQQYADKNRD